uniref:Uncharacterized protein n=1 Tax=Arundo donax TaxID=35708 RepID=A0A0A9GMY8_ARUDO
MDFGIVDISRQISCEPRV